MVSWLRCRKNIIPDKGPILFQDLYEALTQSDSVNEIECTTIPGGHTSLYVLHLSELSCKKAYRLDLTEYFNDQTN